MSHIELDDDRNTTIGDALAPLVTAVATGAPVLTGLPETSRRRDAEPQP
jgi:hypothetical protein